MANSLNILTWPDYINPLTIQQFESEYDAVVRLVIVPSAVELVERMQAEHQDVDVLVPPDYAVRELGGQSRLAVLNHSLLPNLKHLQPRFLSGRPHDPDSRLSIIKDWGTTGFMYRTDRIAENPHAWTDFWSLAARYSGHVTVLDSPGEVIGAALKMGGYSYNDSSPVALASARDSLLSLKPHLLAFETNYKPFLASGEAYLALGWNGDASALSVQGNPVRYVVPVEGSQLWEDDWAVAADAPHPDLAYRFLNFVMRPEVAAQEAMYTRYATGNASALELIEAGMRNDAATYPPDEVIQKLESGMPPDDDGQRRRDQLWRDIRS